MDLDRSWRRLRSALDRHESELPLSVVLLAAGVAAAVLSPLLWLLISASTLEIDAAWTVILAGGTSRILFNSITLVIVVSTASVVIGVPLAILTVQTDLPYRRFWTIVISLPLVVPSYIGAFAYISAFGPRGALSDLLAPLGMTMPTVYGLGGTALVLTLFTYPYVFLTTRASLISFDRQQLEAARTLNHSYLSAFRRVILPQIAPGITAGVLLVALYTLSDFGTPAIMRYDVFTRIIYIELNSFGVGRANATLLSIQLLMITAVILILESRVRGKPAAGYGATPSTTPVVSIGRWRWVSVVYPALITVFTLILPIAILTMWLFRASPGYSGGGLMFQPSFAVNSVFVAVLAAVITVFVALPIAYYAGRVRSPVATIVERATYLGYAMPGVVLGLALVFFSSQWLRDSIGPGIAGTVYQSLPLLIFAYVVRFLPQAVGSTRSSVLGVDRELVGAARLLGAPPQRAFRRVTLPLISPGLLAGAALVFLTTMKELDTTLILHPTGFTTIVTYIWRVQEAGYYGQAALPALLLIILSGLSIIPLVRRNDTTK